MLLEFPYLAQSITISGKCNLKKLELYSGSYSAVTSESLLMAAVVCVNAEIEAGPDGGVSVSNAKRYLCRTIRGSVK